VHLDILCNGNQPDALLCLIYFVNQPLYISGMFIAHHQEVFTVYVQKLVRVIRWLAAGRVMMELDPDAASSQSTYNAYQLLYMYSKYLLMMGNIHARNMYGLIDEIN
jgi:hypothetical protein